MQRYALFINCGEIAAINFNFRQFRRISGVPSTYEKPHFAKISLTRGEKTVLSPTRNAAPTLSRLDTELSCGARSSSKGNNTKNIQTWNN